MSEKLTKEQIEGYQADLEACVPPRSIVNSGNLQSLCNMALHSLTQAEEIEGLRSNDRPCPMCDGRGFNVREVIGMDHGCDGTEADCARKCPVPVLEQEQEACEFCLTTGKVYALPTPRG